MEETLFSTQEDSQALLNLMEKFPYPQHKVYIRKGHGFIVLGKDMADAMVIFNEQVKPHIKK